MSGRRAREVRIRKGRLACFYAYRRRFETKWRQKAPNGMWVDYATVSAALLNAYPWLRDWGPVDAFRTHVVLYSQVVIRQRTAEISAMMGSD